MAAPELVVVTHGATSWSSCLTVGRQVLLMLRLPMVDDGGKFLWVVELLDRLLNFHILATAIVRRASCSICSGSKIVYPLDREGRSSADRWWCSLRCSLQLRCASCLAFHDTIRQCGTSSRPQESTNDRGGV